MRALLGILEATTTDVIGDGDGGGEGLEGTMERVASKTSAGETTRRENRARESGPKASAMAVVVAECVQVVEVVSEDERRKNEGEKFKRRRADGERVARRAL